MDSFFQTRETSWLPSVFHLWKIPEVVQEIPYLVCSVSKRFFCPLASINLPLQGLIVVVKPSPHAIYCDAWNKNEKWLVIFRENNLILTKKIWNKLKIMLWNKNLCNVMSTKQIIMQINWDNRHLYTACTTS